MGGVTVRMDLPLFVRCGAPVQQGTLHRREFERPPGLFWLYSQHRRAPAEFFTGRRVNLLRSDPRRPRSAGFSRTEPQAGCVESLHRGCEGIRRAVYDVEVEGLVGAESPRPIVELKLGNGELENLIVG